MPDTIIAAAAPLLALLMRGGQYGYYWTDKGRRSKWWRADAPAPVPGAWKNIYFGVHPSTIIPPTNNKGEPKPAHAVRAQISTIAAINALFGEFDDKDFGGDHTACLTHIHKLDVPPTVIVDSGGGYHCYWILREPWILATPADRERARKLQAAWVTLVDSDPEAKDLARVLRLPGTFNYKYEVLASDEQEYVPPRPVTIIEADYELLYELDDLATLAEPFIESDRPAAPATSTTSSPASTSRKEAYVLKALNDECELVRTAPKGHRHNQLIRSACTLGELVAGEVLDRDLAFNSLRDAVSLYSEDLKHDEQTILDGFEYGKTRPRGVPAEYDDDAVSYMPIVKKPRSTVEVSNPEDEADDAAAEPEEEKILKIVIPTGYRFNGRVMKRVKSDGNSFTVYPGRIWPEAIGTDIATGEQTLTISWNGKGEHGTLTAERKHIAAGASLLDRAAAQGAAIHAGNAAQVATMLIEMVAENADILPRELVCNRYGYVNTDSFEHVVIMPARAIGTALDIRYTGRSPSKVSADPEAYPAALRAMMSWKDAPVAALVIALALAGPCIARIRPPRNPTLYLAGPSNIGKTTLALFALAAYGNPYKRPFLVQVVGLSQAGAYTALKNQAGLPIAFDEAHMGEPGFIEKIAYNFSNGETRTQGSLDGRGQGGEELFGSLILLGEANVEFRNAGAANRRLGVDGNKTPPLGAGSVGEPGTPEYALGAERAEILRRAIDAGAGIFGPLLMEHIWNNWPAFLAEVRRHETAPCLKELGAWARSLSILFATLIWACELAGAEMPPPELLDTWVEILKTGRELLDPATEAFESVLSLFQAAQIEPEHRTMYTGWEVKEYMHEPVAYRRNSDDYWRIPTGSKPFIDRVGKSAVQHHGAAWRRRGWVIPTKGEVSATKGIADGSARCICIHEDTPKTWIARSDDD